MHRYHRGFSFIELLVALLILAILYSFILPTYTKHILAAQRSQAEATLVQTAILIEEYYFLHHNYQGVNLKILHLKNLIANNSYQLQIKSSDTTYQLIAIPLAQQKRDTECATLSLNSLGEKNISGTGGLEECWH